MLRKKKGTARDLAVSFLLERGENSPLWFSLDEEQIRVRR